MKKTYSSDQILAIGIVFALIISALGITVYLVGRGYRQSISKYESPDIKTNVNVDDALDVTGITFRRSGQSDCIKIGSDGQVKIHKVCEEESDESYRTYNYKGVNRLMELVRTGRLSTAKKSGNYELIVHTDQGDIVYYFDESDLGGGGGGSSGGGNILDEIIKIIEDIKNDQPQNTPTSTLAPTSPAATITVGPTPSPTIYNPFAPTPTPTPPPGVSVVGFSCDYIDDPAGSKPYRVSNIVCSTEPEEPR